MAASLFAGAPLAQAQTGQSGGCPLVSTPKIVSASTYRVTTADKCWLIVLTATGNITVQLPAPGLIFPPGFRTSVLPLNGGTITFSGLADQSGTVHKVNLQNSLLMSGGVGAHLTIQQDYNWWAEGYGGSLGLDSIPAGRMIGYPPSGYTFAPGNPFTFTAPSPLSITTTGTVTSGLAEALAVLSTNKLSGEFYGNDNTDSSSGAFAIGGTSGNGVTFPTLRNQVLRFPGTGIYGVGGGTNVVKLDSMLGAVVDFTGSQIGMSQNLSGAYTGATVLINPTGTTPAPESVVGISQSVIKLGLLSRESAGTATLEMSLGSGSFLQSYLRAEESNGAGHANTPLSTNCVQIDSPSATTGLLWSTIDIGDIHNCISTGYAEGIATTNQGSLKHNRVILGRVHPALSGTTAVGYSTYASYGDIIARIDNDGLGTANLADCAVFRSGATHNKAKIYCSDVNGHGNAVGVLLASGSDYNDIDLYTEGTITTPISDLSGAHNTYRVNGQVMQEWRNGLQFNYLQPTSVSAGSGAVFQTGSGNSKGVIVVGGAGAQQTAAITFSMSFVQSVNCIANSSQALTQITATASNQTSATLSAFDTSTGAAKNMTNGTLIAYECWGQGT